MKTVGQTRDQKETEASALTPDIVGFPPQLIHALRIFVSFGQTVLDFVDICA